jgi:hypothetical protein
VKRAKPLVGPFAQLPVDVLTSAAVRTLPHIAHRVLVALTAQYHGGRNGSLTLTRRTARDYGIGDAHALGASLRELEDRGLIVRTRPGSRLPPRSAMYAISWRPIDAPLPYDSHDALPTVKESNSYGAWTTAETSPHWTTRRRAARWRVPTSPSGAYPLREAEMGGACPPRTPDLRVARTHTSHISGVGPSQLMRQRRRKAA